MSKFAHFRLLLEIPHFDHHFAAVFLIFLGQCHLGQYHFGRMPLRTNSQLHVYKPGTWEGLANADGLAHKRTNMDTNAKKCCESCSGFFSKLQDLNNSGFCGTHCGANVGKGDKVMLTRHDHHLKNCSVTKDILLCICDLLEDSDRFWNYEKYY